MRVAAAAVGVALLASSGQTTPPSVRLLTDVALGVFDCAANRTHRLITSDADLAKTLAVMAPHCPADIFDQRRDALLRGVERTQIDWSEEVLVVVQDWYGTGMAKPTLAFAEPSSGTLVATIQWKVPPPPVTPDTRSCTFAFAVKRAAIARITVTGQNSGSQTFVVSRQPSPSFVDCACISIEMRAPLHETGGRP